MCKAYRVVSKAAAGCCGAARHEAPYHATVLDARLELTRTNHLQQLSKMPRIRLFQGLLFLGAVLHCAVLIRLGVVTLSTLLNSGSDQPLLKRAAEVSSCCLRECRGAQ